MELIAMRMVVPHVERSTRAL